MTALVFSSDPGLAKQSAREFARCADDIRQAVTSVKGGIVDLEGAFRQLRDSMLNSNTDFVQQPDITRFAAVHRSTPQGFAEPAFRGDLLVPAKSSQEEATEALEQLIERERNVLQSALDSIADFIESFGGILDFLPEEIAKVAKRVNLATIPLRLADALIETFDQKTAEESFQLFNDLNAAAPGLRELAERSNGKATEVFELLFTGFANAADNAVANILTKFLQKKTTANDLEIFGDGPGQMISQELEILEDFLESIRRTAVDPAVSEKVRRTLGLEDLETELPLSDQRSLLIGGDTNFVRIADRSPLAIGGGSQFASLDSSFGGLAANDVSFPNLEQAEQDVIDFAAVARKAFEDYANSATDVSGQVEGVIGGALMNMEDALVQFVQTGKLDFRSLVDSMIADLIRLTIRAAVLGPLANALAGAFSPSTPGSGGSGPGAGGGKGSPGAGGGFTTNAVAANAVSQGAVNLNVVVENNGNDQVETQSRTNSLGEPELRVIIGRLAAQDVREGGPLSQAIAQNSKIIGR